ncbi:MAG: hypothetical protein M9904_09725 [Chitinophagaceae bacterium]|nr:hypothetical protein [Chitinophagaceae bacterium]
MNKFIFLLSCMLLLSLFSYSQLGVLKMIGQDAEKAKLGYSLFLAYNINASEAGNRVVTLELLDGGFFPDKQEYEDRLIGYISIKAGYRYIFNEEDKTGFFLEPQLGYCKVVRNREEALSKSGVAAALIGGYSLQTDSRGSSLCFGLKYEADVAGKEYTLQSIGFRVAYIFSLTRR